MEWPCETLAWPCTEPELPCATPELPWLWLELPWVVEWPELPCVEAWPVWCVPCLGFDLPFDFVVDVSVDAVGATPTVGVAVLVVAAHGPSVSSWFAM